jgi:Protein of unknown function (DUF732)
MGRNAQPSARHLTGSWAAQAPGRAAIYGVPVKGVFVSIVVAAAASLAFVGVAGADTDDENYLNLINASGLGCGQGPFSCPTGDSDMIQIGRAICRQLTHGNSSLAVSQAIIRQKPGVQPDMVVRLVAIAKTAYCPT